MLTSLRQAIYNSLFFFKALHFLDCIHTLLCILYSRKCTWIHDDWQSVLQLYQMTWRRPLGAAAVSVRTGYMDFVHYFPSPVGWIHLERCYYFRCRDPFLHLKICPKRMELRCCRCWWELVWLQGGCTASEFLNVFNMSQCVQVVTCLSTLQYHQRFFSISLLWWWIPVHIPERLVVLALSGEAGT